jgi:hypothetical protein
VCDNIGGIGSPAVAGRLRNRGDAGLSTAGGGPTGTADGVAVGAAARVAAAQPTANSPVMTVIAQTTVEEDGRLIFGHTYPKVCRCHQPLRQQPGATGATACRPVTCW